MRIGFDQLVQGNYCVLAFQYIHFYDIERCLLQIYQKPSDKSPLILIVCRLIVIIAVPYLMGGVNMDIIKVFGTNVKNYRRQAGLSQEAFAEKCGMHRTYISAIECFRRSISLENIQRIADALNIEAYMLLLENKHKEGTENDK